MQTGYQYPIAFRDRRGGTIGIGVILNSRVIYKANYVCLTGKNNIEQSIEILLSKNTQRSSLSIGASYYWSTSEKDFIPGITFNQFEFIIPRLGFIARLGLSLFAIGWGALVASPILQGNLTYRLF